MWRGQFRQSEGAFQGGGVGLGRQPVEQGKGVGEGVWHMADQLTISALKES